MKMNAVEDTDGEMALWIDGKQVSRLGKGFPNGKRVFDKFMPGQGGDAVRWSDKKGGPVYFKVPDDGAPFEGFRWRTDEQLNLNFLWVLLYITKAPQDHVSQVWFDNIVVAEEYIGPMVPKNGEKESLKKERIRRGWRRNRRTHSCRRRHRRCR